MRVFKHGDAVAVVFPDSLAKKHALKEGDELEFYEVEPRVYVLASKQKVAELVSSSFYPKTASAPSTAPAKQESELKKALYSKGFLSIENEFQARSAGDELKGEISSRAVVSARGFDKKAFLVTRSFFDENAPKVMRALREKDLALPAICEASKLPQEACAALLCVLEEQGEILEKRKGLFQLVK